MDVTPKNQPMIIVSTRPNIVKAAPIVHELSRRNINYTLLHTGQHYDEEMSGSMMTDLNMPKIDIQLSISGNRDLQETLFEQQLIPILEQYQPSYVMVFGDVDGAFFSMKMAGMLNVPIAHVEAGLRSFDITMQEERNRIAIDKHSRWLFVTEQSGIDNLQCENIDSRRVYLVGNVMIDALKSISISEEVNVEPYVVWTMHRPSNVDTQAQIEKWLKLMEWTAQSIKIFWFLHPRTLVNLKKWDQWREKEEQLSSLNIEIHPPLGYAQFHRMIKYAKAIVTDSGGIQEEAFYLKTPCLTLRNSTERPITLSNKANVLVEHLCEDKFKEEINRVLMSPTLGYAIPEHWDGQTAGRIIDVLHPN